MVASLSEIEDLKTIRNSTYQATRWPLSLRSLIQDFRSRPQKEKGRHRAGPYAPLAQNLKYQLHDFRSKGK
jgi:hypothetical protein